MQRENSALMAEQAETGAEEIITQIEGVERNLGIDNNLAAIAHGKGTDAGNFQAANSGFIHGKAALRFHNIRKRRYAA